MLVVLKEQAKKAGLELKLKVLEPTAAWKAANEKNHQVVFSAFNSFDELFPRFWEPYHSDNAYQESGDSKYQDDGSLKPGLTTKVSTNNFTQTAVRKIDHLINQYREEEDLGRITDMAHQLSQMIHDHAVWVPAWKKPWLRIGHWNWLSFQMIGGPRNLGIMKSFKFSGSINPRRIKSYRRWKRASVSDKPTIRIYEKYNRVNAIS